MKKNQIISKIRIQGMAAEGKCIARHEDRVIFIAGNKVAPGDLVDLKIIAKKKRFFEAVPVHFYEYASLRVNPTCEHFGTCGGCKWQHIHYETQLLYKQQHVKDSLERIAKVEIPSFPPILGADKILHYRNKLEFTFSNKRWLTTEEIAHFKQHIEAGQKPDETHQALGFHIPGRFDKILDIRECHLQEDPSNTLRLAVRDYGISKNIPFFDLREQTGFLRNMVIRTSNTGDLMVILLVAKDHQEWIQDILKFLRSKFPEITSLFYIVNTKRNDSYQDLEPVLFAGKPYIEAAMEDLRFRIGPKSFYQTNSAQAYELYRIAREFAALQGDELVYDLYTGTGTIANFVARQAKKVIGIEYVEEAIRDARINSEINTIHNTAFFAGDMKDILTSSFVAREGTPEVIITDPPRAGMHGDVVKRLLEVAPEKIVYVSCNPATQARDLALLDETYVVTAIQAVDMFPQTHHVENVVKLEKRK